MIRTVIVNALELYHSCTFTMLSYSWSARLVPQMNKHARDTGTRFLVTGHIFIRGDIPQNRIPYPGFQLSGTAVSGPDVTLFR
jgi:hypothetical protein